jgi:hypothetical protein
VVSMSGTSMAAPHVAGATAALLSGNPSLTPAAATTALLASATPGAVTALGAGSPNLLLYVDPSAGEVVSSPPAAPGSAQIALTSATSAAVTWSAPSDTSGASVTGYSLTLRNTSTGATISTRTVSSTTLSSTFTSLLAGTSYQAGVRAITASGASAETLTGTVTAPTAPDPVRGLTFSVTGVATLTASWTSSLRDGGSPVIDHEVIVRNASTGAVVSTTTVSSSTGAVRYTGLTVGTSYRVTVTARNAAGISTGTTSAAITAATTPGIVRNLTVSYPATLKTRLAWSAPSSTGGSPILRYEYRVSTTSDTSSWTTWTSTATTTSATITGIARGVVRYAQVRAVTAAGAGASVQVTIRPTI